MTNVLILSLQVFFGLGGFYMFDRLVMEEYKSHRRNWEEDGQPHGFFWVPKEVRKLGGWIIRGRSSSASWRCSFVWLFSTPDWVRGDRKAKRFLFWLRLFVGIWNISTLLIVLFTFSQ
jgi:hypothetical protein